MKKTWQVLGVTALVAGALVYPAYKLYQYMTRKTEDENDGSDHHVVKAFVPAYRGKRHKTHNHE